MRTPFVAGNWKMNKTAEQARTIRLPVHVGEFLSSIARAQRELASRLGREPSLVEVAEYLELPISRVEETLRALQESGIGLAVVTDAESFQARRRLEKTGLIDYFETVVTPDLSGRCKPEPDSLLYALRRLGAKPEEAMMVGDSAARDIAAGRRLGMVTAFAAYGDWRQSRVTDVGADIVLAEFAQLRRYLSIPGKG